MMIRRECEDKRNAQGEDIDLAKKRVRPPPPPPPPPPSSSSPPPPPPPPPSSSPPLPSPSSL
jgi:hypothetical protein